MSIPGETTPSEGAGMMTALGVLREIAAAKDLRLLQEIENLKSLERKEWTTKSDAAIDEEEWNTFDERLRQHKVRMADLERFEEAVIAVRKVGISIEEVLEGELGKLRERHEKERREQSLERELRDGEGGGNGGSQGSSQGNNQGSGGGGGGGSGDSQGIEGKGEDPSPVC
ncbi:hypothetical protein B0T21DRAFT_346700 [Apiosordaria backusii]|uniref:Uncharacterized protein n=1 Tax=Apiosordaria backusii TaxID=314023 RepID=A0AA40EI52_9PEZI|nr:hypothetical protein B0T21DRAFT_346700 [Apiosordaria backusii]